MKMTKSKQKNKPLQLLGACKQTAIDYLVLACQCEAQELNELPNIQSFHFIYRSQLFVDC